jgi:hypothetical protein
MSIYFIFFMIRYLSICLDASLEQFLGNGDSVSYFGLIKLINSDCLIHFGLIVQKIKKCIISKQELHACVYLNSFIQMHLDFSKKEFISYTKNGFVDYLLKMITLDAFFDFLFQISCCICRFFQELEMKNEMNLVLKHLIESLKEEDSVHQENSKINEVLETLDQISELDQHVIDIDFKIFLELILEKHENYIFEYASFLVSNRNVHEECLDLIPIAFEKMFEILSTDDEIEMISNPFLYLEDILEMIQFDFLPWISKAIKSCANRIMNSTSEEIDSVFKFLIRLIELFGDECEIYISKYKVVPLTIQIINFNTDSIENGFQTRFLVAMSFHRFKLLEMYIPSILKESNKLLNIDRM